MYYKRLERNVMLVAAVAVLASGSPAGMGLAAGAMAQSDPYETYIKTSKDFKEVKQDQAMLWKAWPSWTLMPWYFQWSIGYDDAAAKFCKDTGINGAFVDRGHTEHMAWFDENKLRFYMDHTAGKGDLHLWDGLNTPEKKNMVHGTGMRERPVNAAMKGKLEGIIKGNIEAVKRSPMRSAYALDDEISWGHFVHPTMWRVTDDAAAYSDWLKEIYGSQAPARTGWISYNDIRAQLAAWSVASFDASPLMDQWTFNDSIYNNLLGDLVNYANSIDPATPVGYVGAQQPSPFGGYDYAKLTRKVQFIESYNGGNSQAIFRSFNPGNAMPQVSTFFYGGLDGSIWQAWYYLAQGNRGHIAWVDKWFNADKTPKPWLKAIAPTWLECGQKIGPLVSGAEWKHDGVALYYSHASIQLGWIMDAVAHKGTWINRNDDASMGGLPQCRNAWLNMLRDEGLQFGMVNYVDLIKSGVPSQYKVLILSSTLCLSDAEARKIKEFCQAGGTVIADYLPGLWDQHGKGRATGGALDDLFGVKHDPAMTCKDVFNGNGVLWCEANQDASYGTPNTLLIKANSCIKDDSGFNKAVRNMSTIKVAKVGKGTAVLMNLSPQWYNVYRHEGVASAAKRAVFMKPIHDAGLDRWVSLKNVGDREFGYEITYWRKGPRTILFLIPNKDVVSTQVGGGGAVGVVADSIPVTLAFAAPVQNAKDERSGKSLGNGKEFTLEWKLNEACVISFDNR